MIDDKKGVLLQIRENYNFSAQPLKCLAFYFIIYFPAVLGLLYFEGWQNHGFGCIGACQPLIVQFVTFFLAKTIWLAECVEFLLLF
jgi:hypothetical protein